MSTKLSVIILAHNKADMSLRCLAALATALTDLDHEVLLRDNGSTENLEALQNCHEMFHRFRFIRGEENLSFSIANNCHVREATGNLLLFLNNDVFLQPKTIQNMIRPLLEDKTVGCTGGKLLYPGELSVQSAGIVQTLWGYPSNYAVGANPENRQIKDRCERFALTGAMLCITSELFQRIGGFDERYFWGIEDVDLCLKARMLGMKAVYCPEAVAVHCESATLKTKRSDEAAERNYRLYRQLWDSMLVPAEQSYIRSLKDQGIRQVAVLGMGTAARGLSKILAENGIGITAFTSSDLKQPGEFLGCQTVPFDMLEHVQYDRLMVASQYFFEMEDCISAYDPMHEPIYPLLS